jgi:glycosyltransferase
MLISIITPTYNSEKTISRNINSVIGQKYSDFEHIIIDNLSTDKTIQIAQEIYTENNSTPKLRIISEKDEGISDAFNKGIEESRGDIIAILNSDDSYFNNNVFSRVLKAFREDSTLFVHGNMYFIDDNFGTNIRKPLLCKLTGGMPYNHPTMFLKKELFDKYGLFDLSYKYAMDYELIVRYEKEIKNFRKYGKYITGEPLAIQYAGGASWRNELESISEVKLTLKRYNLWNNEAALNYFFRKSRTILKSYVSFLRLNFLVKIWRRIKWKN